MTDQTLPAPLVPAEVDLRGYEFMPLYGVHLFGSEFNSRCSDAGWRAGLTLWWAAWNQVPAASLPSDDAALCRLADLGRDMKAWAKIKDEALHGFVLCSDGRLYHKFLAPKAIDAWERRVGERERKQKWRDKRRGHERLGDGDRDGTSPLTVTGRGTETENLEKTPYPAGGGEPDVEIGSGEDEDAQPQYRAPPPGRKAEGTNPRANGQSLRQTGQNARANGTNPRSIAKANEAAEAKALADARLAKWTPRLAQFAATGQWDRTWGTQPSINPAIAETGVFLPPALWDEFRAIARARAGPGGKAA